MTSGSVEAWGESSPLAAPCYSPEWAGGVFSLVRDWMAPAILGRDFQSGDQLQAALSIYKGNPFAKAVLDSAYWSLAAKLANRPLHELLGATRYEVTVGADFGVMDSVSELLPLIGQAIQDRYPRIKLKFRPGWDIEMLRAVRGKFRTHTFHIDCNSGYSLNDLAIFQRVDEFQLAMIEQPLHHDDLVDHAKLQSAIRTPVCLDESIVSPRHAQMAVQLASCRYVNVKPARVGGLTNAVKVHDLCRKAGVPGWVGGMLESATGAAQCAALAMLDNFSYPADIFPSARFYHEDLSDPPLILHRSPDGVPMIRAFEHLPEPVPGRLAKLTVQQAVLRNKSG
jgi:O-succinylbenzoate synthase